MGDRGSIRDTTGRVSGRSAALGEAPSGLSEGPEGDPLDLRLARMVHIFRLAAQSGEPAPTNDVLGKRLGLSKAYVSKMVREAETRCMIVVERSPSARKVRAPDHSWRTA